MAIVGESAMRIGFIGLGHMGHPMVRQLLANHHPVTVFDVAPVAIDALTAHGAKAAASPAEVAANTDVVFTMLQTGEQVVDVCSGEQGIFAQAKRGLLYIDSSSIDVAMTRQLHRQAQAHGIAMLDAPVSGGVVGAAQASLTIMVGGANEAFQQALPILQCVGKTIIHAGAAGNGQVAKICNNLILGISMIAVSEAFTLAEQLGLDAQTFFQISRQSSGECWAMTHYCPVPGVLPDVPANHEYQPGFTAAMMLKDLRLSQTAASDVHLDTPLGARASELYRAFNESGHGQLDFSAIIQMLKSTLTE
jgi:3-hydroxyisobutyrate dehydrogenase